jgi:hypothetical protein
MSPFFADPTKKTIEYDIKRGNAQWALSFYEERGPLEDEYGKPNRNCRPVASYLWGTVRNIVQAGNVVSFDMILAPSFQSNAIACGYILPIKGVHMDYDTATQTGQMHLLFTKA